MNFFVFIIEKIGSLFKWILGGISGGLSTVFNLLFEPKTTLHTGDIETKMTIRSLDWI